VDNKFLRTHGENLLRAYKHSVRGK